jgi:S-adenosylmethionine:tRNA ribosyltransferase-isomerase
VEELDIPGGRLVAFVGSEDEEETIARLGKTPLPPYINRPAEEIDRYRYQTVYAVDNGSAAAPTAGLHFTTQLLDRIKAKGINITYILLHIGLGTFRPVESQDIRRHQMHSEYYQIEPATAKILNNTRESGGRIIAVGTTSVRTLESACDLQAGFLPQQGETNIFIYPGYKFKAVDGLITNFHLPGSSLIMLVAALAGLDNTLAAYHRAIKQEYRFFSYGDAMLII